MNSCFSGSRIPALLETVCMVSEVEFVIENPELPADEGQ